MFCLGTHTRYRALLGLILGSAVAACSHAPPKKSSPTRSRRSARLPSRSPAPLTKPKPAAPTVKTTCVAGFEGCGRLRAQRGSRSALRADYGARAAAQRASLERLAGLLEDPGIRTPGVRAELDAKLDDSKQQPAKHAVELSVQLDQGAWTTFSRADEIRAAIQGLRKAAFEKGDLVDVPVREVCIEDRAGDLSDELRVATSALAGLRWRSPGPFEVALVLEGERHLIIEEATTTVKHGFDAVTGSGRCAVVLELPGEGSLRLKRRFELDDQQLCAVRAGTVRFSSDPEDRRQRYAIVPRGGAR